VKEMRTVAAAQLPAMILFAARLQPRPCQHWGVPAYLVRLQAASLFRRVSARMRAALALHTLRLAQKLDWASATSRLALSHAMAVCGYGKERGSRAGLGRCRNGRRAGRTSPRSLSRQDILDVNATLQLRPRDSLLLYFAPARPAKRSARDGLRRHARLLLATSRRRLSD
jgi:hypothetical protein